MPRNFAHVTHALITSNLDDFNSLCLGLPLLQIAAAFCTRLLTGANKTEHITLYILYTVT